MSQLSRADRLEAARLAAAQCGGDAHKFTTLANAIHAFLTSTTEAHGTPQKPEPFREIQG